MSTPERRLRLSPEARSDLRGIRLYLLRRWSTEQANVYIAMLTRSLDLLRVNPMFGVAKDGISPGLRTHLGGRHNLYYRAEDDTVEVARILHERVDPVRHLQP